MAPKRGESIVPSDEREKFMTALTAYHEKRGTSLEAEPKVGVRRIDLHNLYLRVLEEGGYDLVSDTKAKPLMWRKFAEEFVGKNVYSAAQAFQIKQIYYKNLVAYEITTHWKKDPPPKEILEDVSAKGGNVMTRTLENYVKKEDLKDNAASPQHTTPKDGADLDDPGSASGRMTRGLRQQPSQRVLFQPDLNSARQTRGQTQSTPGYSLGSLPNGNIPNGTSSTLASYEPSQSYPLSLRPVITPANNLEFYRNERKRKLEASAGPLARKYRNIMLPGTGFIGPNIYVRAQLALQSGLPDEERYALHHLVKISHERGDKYKFDQFPGLAEALARKVLCASGLFYDVEWTVNYDDDVLVVDDETLDGLRGTTNIIDKLKSRPLPIIDDQVVDGNFLDQISRITEAALVFRNMCTMEDNARYAASFPLTRDVMAVIVNLPNHWCITELRNYMLETAEMTLKYCDLNTQQDLYKGLLKQVESTDRGTAVLAMRVTSRLAMLLPSPKKLEYVSSALLGRIQDWLLVEDEELRGACLDFLMQYTTFAENVDHLLQSIDGEALARQLSRLLLYNAKTIRQAPTSVKPADDHSIPPVPRLSSSVVKQLITLDEPERSSEWLRMCFLPDSDCEMTQISLWQAYQGTFGAYPGNLIAGEFIKNVSAVYTGATAQVAGQNKYVIRGIKSRKAPVETGTLANSRPGSKDQELLQCRWTMQRPIDNATGITPPSAPCGEWFQHNDDLMRHLLQRHVELPLKQVGNSEANGDAMDVDAGQDANAASTETLREVFDFASAKPGLHCQWASCKRTAADLDNGKAVPAVLLARHIATHIPDKDGRRNAHNLRPAEQWTARSGERPPPAPRPMALSIMTDERQDAYGLPLSAALILSHIARFMPKTSTSAKDDVRAMMGAEKEGEKSEAKEAEQAEQLVEKIFGAEVKERMFFALSHCAPARSHVNNILSNIRRNAG